MLGPEADMCEPLRALSIYHISTARDACTVRQDFELGT